jgi:hypothetical protein
VADHEAGAACAGSHGLPATVYPPRSPPRGQWRVSVVDFSGRLDERRPQSSSAVPPTGFRRLARPRSALLIGDPEKDLRAFRVAPSSKLGANADRDWGSLINSVLDAVDRSTPTSYKTSKARPKNRPWCAISLTSPLRKRRAVIDRSFLTGRQGIPQAATKRRRNTASRTHRPSSVACKSDARPSQLPQVTPGRLSPDAGRQQRR